MHAVGNICISHRVTGSPPRRLRSVTGVVTSRSAKAPLYGHLPGPTSSTGTLCREVNLPATAGRCIRSPDTSAATVPGELPPCRARNTRPIPPEPSLPSRRYVRIVSSIRSQIGAPAALGAGPRDRGSGPAGGSRTRSTTSSAAACARSGGTSSRGSQLPSRCPRFRLSSRASVSRPAAQAVLPTRQDHGRVMKAFESSSGPSGRSQTGHRCRMEHLSTICP